MYVSAANRQCLRNPFVIVPLRSCKTSTEKSSKVCVLLMRSSIPLNLLVADPITEQPFLDSFPGYCDVHSIFSRYYPALGLYKGTSMLWHTGMVFAKADEVIVTGIFIEYAQVCHRLEVLLSDQASTTAKQLHLIAKLESKKIT